MYIKRVMISIFSIYLALPMPASFASGEAPKEEVAELSIREKLAFQKHARGKMLAKNVFEKVKSMPPKIPNLTRKIESTPAGKIGKAGINKAALTFFTTIALLTAKEVSRLLQEEGAPLTTENVEKKITEVELEWDKTEHATHSAIDAAILYPLILAAEKGVEKALPTLANRKFAGTLLHSFIVGLVFSSFNNLGDKVFVLANEYLMRHPEIVGGITDGEQARLTLLEQRLGFSYFTRGLFSGDAVTKSAYRKLLSALSWTIFEEEELRGILWSHALREYALNGSLVTSLGVSVISGTLRTKIVPESAKWATYKKTLFGFAVLGATSVFLPESFQDRITFMTRKLAGLKSKNTLLDIGHAATSGELHDLFKKSDTERQELASYAFSTIKIANDRIVSIVADQKKLSLQISALKDAPLNGQAKAWDAIKNSYRLFLLESPLTSYRLQAAFEENIKLLTYYQSIVEYSFSTILDTYAADISDIDRQLVRKNKLINEYVEKRTKLLNLSAFIKYFSEVLSYQFDPQSVDFARNHEEFTRARQYLDKASFWGYSEEDLLPIISD